MEQQGAAPGRAAQGSRRALLSPDPVLQPHEADYRWLSQVYVSVQPTSGNGRLIWHALGAKTIELIHQNIHVEPIRDDLETLVIDEAVLEIVLSAPEAKKKAKEVEWNLTARLRKHMASPKFRALSDRLEDLKDRVEKGLIDSREFLKALLVLARDFVAAETETPVVEDLGYIALEAMLAGKPLVTLTDAGEPAALTRDGREGLVTAPDPQAFADALSRLAAPGKLARTLGSAALERYAALDISWSRVVQTLTGDAA